MRPCCSCSRRIGQQRRRERLTNLLLHDAILHVHLGSVLLEDGKAPDDLNGHARSRAPNLEVLQGALSLCAPVHIIGHLNLAHSVALHAAAHCSCCCSWRCPTHGHRGHGAQLQRERRGPRQSTRAHRGEGRAGGARGQAQHLLMGGGIWRGSSCWTNSHVVHYWKRDF